jgi:hypothetical protein
VLFRLLVSRADSPMPVALSMEKRQSSNCPNLRPGCGGRGPRAKRQYSASAIQRESSPVPRTSRYGLKTGWFGDRTACYLVAGRAVIAQDKRPSGFGDKTAHVWATFLLCLKFKERRTLAARKATASHVLEDRVFAGDKFSNVLHRESKAVVVCGGWKFSNKGRKSDFAN